MSVKFKYRDALNQFPRYIYGWGGLVGLVNLTKGSLLILYDVSFHEINKLGLKSISFPLEYKSSTSFFSIKT